MFRRIRLVNAFGILWFLLTPLAIHEDYPLVDALGIDIKTYYMGLYICSNLVILLVVLANIDHFLHQPQPQR